MKQINLKMPESLFSAARKHVEKFGFRNVQDLALESMREKIFENKVYDESFSEKEIELIDALIEASIKSKDYGTEEELRKILKE